MQVLKEMPARKGGPGGGGRAPKYDYDKFLNGKILKLVEGEDFSSEGKNPKQSFLSNVRTAAEQRGLKLVTRVDDEGVIIQSVPLTDEDRAAREKRAANRAANQAAKANGNGDSK
jgi:hypothetical protein